MLAFYLHMIAINTLNHWISLFSTSICPMFSLVTSIDLDIRMLLEGHLSATYGDMYCRTYKEEINSVELNFSIEQEINNKCDESNKLRR